MVNNVLDNTTTIGDFIDKVARAYGGTVAFEIRRRVKKEQVLYLQLPSLTDKIHALLVSRGLEQKDRVVVCGLNCPEYSVLLLALFSKGYVTVPVDYRTTAEVVSKIISETQPKMAFVSRFINGEVFLNSAGNLVYIEDLFEIVEGVNLEVTQHASSYHTKSDEVCEIVYTSGTTGAPKGVMITQNNILTNIASTYKRLPSLHSYRTISILPLSHMLEQIIGLFLSLAYGSRVTYLSRVNSLKLKEAMLETKPTYMVFVPQMLSIFWQRIELEARKAGKYSALKVLLRLSGYLPFSIRKYLFPQIHKLFGGSLAYIGCGGAPLNYDICRNFTSMGFSVLEGYGATEVTAVASFNADHRRLGCAGKPLDGVEVKADEAGQLLIKSPSVSLGYFNKPDKTREVFVEGWYKTGDIGSVRESGEICVTGRDAFKIVLASGEKIYVEDLEKKVLMHRKVRDCCVLGLQENNADRIHAVIILKEGVGVDEIAEIIKDINITLEAKQQIFDYSVWHNQEFPRTFTLKIDRAMVKSMILQNLQALEHVEATQNFEVGGQTGLLDILEKVTGINRAKILDTDVLGSDLNIDSLDRGELVSSIEENMGVTIDIIKITSSSTVADLKKLLVEGQKVENAVKIPTWQFTKLGELFRTALLYTLAYPIHSVFARLKLEYEDGYAIRPGSILVFNHAGLFDVLCIFRMLRKKSIKIISLADSDFWKNKYFSRLLEAFGGAVPLDQSGRNLIPLLQSVSDVMPSRYLLLAPQGRLQRSPVQDRFKAGVGFFAVELEAPIVPIKLVGYENIWPAPGKSVNEMSLKDIFPKRIGEVKVKIGKPIVPNKTSDYTEIANLLEEKFEKL